MAGGRGSKLPSFHLDLSSGKEKNEVVYHNGAVAAAGIPLEVPTPVNSALNSILTKLAQNELDRDLYNGKPKRLVADVAKYQQAVKERS